MKVICGCSVIGPSCPVGKYYFNKLAEIHSVISAIGFVGLPTPIKDQIWEVYNQRNKRYLDHVYQQDGVENKSTREG